MQIPPAGGTLAVRVNRLEVFSILLLFELQRSPGNQSGAKSLKQQKNNVRYCLIKYYEILTRLDMHCWSYSRKLSIAKVLILTGQNWAEALKM